MYKRRYYLTSTLALLLLAGCPDPEPVPKPPPMPSMNDMNSAEDMSAGDMAASDMDASDMADMAADMAADMDDDVDMGADMAEEDMAPDMCVPWTNSEMCAQYNFGCSPLEAVDNCGEMRMIESCGECASPQLCERTVDENDAITATACGCSPENASDICAAVGKLCGPIEPPCEAVVCDEFCVDAVAAGNNFNCAIGSGKVRCWGDNGDGQLGLGDSTARKNPTSITTLPIIVDAIAAGGEHTCVLLEDTSVICWGANDVGQLGVGTDVGATAPDLNDINALAFAKGEGVAKVTAGDEHTCALVDSDFNLMKLNNGEEPAPPYSAYCWGTNQLGILGNPDRVIVNASAAVPIQVLGLTDNVYDIAAGSTHTCAIIDAGDMAAPNKRRVTCWGNSDVGQTGANPIFRPPEIPMVTPPGLGNYKYVDTHNEAGDLFFYPSPVLVQASANAITAPPVGGQAPETGSPFEGEFVELTAGRTYTCVRDTSDAVYCWGMMPFKHLSGTCKDPNKDAEPNMCSIWPRYRGFTGYVLNTDETGDIVPFIDQNFTQGARKFESSGDKIGLPQGRFDSIASAARPVQMLHYGGADTSLLPTGVAAGQPVSSSHIAGHNEHFCMLVEEPAVDRTNVYCMGHNATGEVGDGTDSPTGRPLPIKGDVNGNIVRGTQLELGDLHSCVVADNNNIKCWGSNAKSQIGNENLMRDSSFRPFDVLLR